VRLVANAKYCQLGKQVGLRAGQACAARDQPPAMERGLGDLRLPALGIVGERDPRGLGDQVDQGADRLALLDADRELDAA